jgi:hypothetical protein
LPKDWSATKQEANMTTRTETVGDVPTPAMLTADQLTQVSGGGSGYFAQTRVIIDTPILASFEDYSDKVQPLRLRP